MDHFISDILDNLQFNAVLIAPILLVFLGVVLVFMFGFKKPIEPKFKKLASIDNVKKSKRKEKIQKSTQNGDVITLQEKLSDAKKKDVNQQQQKGVTVSQVGKKEKSLSKIDASPSKKSEEKNKINVSSPTKKQTTKKEKNQLIKQKSVEIAAGQEDDGEWMTVTKDRKKKIEDLLVISTSVTEKKTDKLQKKKDGQKQNKIQTPVKLDKKDLTTIAVTAEETSKKTEIEIAPIVLVDLIKETTENVVQQQHADVVVQEPVMENKIQLVDNEDIPAVSSNNVVFDELGDAWTEAKPPRKSKKKSRKE